MIKISAVVLTKNEEKNIVDCLETILFCHEIIVVDDNSTDRTLDVVEQYKKEHFNIEIFQRDLGYDFSAQRKFGIAKSSNDWILFIDADEKITPELANEISENVTGDFGGFLIPRIDYMWGKFLKHGETGNIKLLRLFNKNKGNLKGKVHETWITKEKVGNLQNPMLHYPHPNISLFLKEINFYTDLRSKELFDSGTKSNFLSVIVYPKLKFLTNYFLKLGFLDGIAGLVHAVLMSFHSFMVRGKLWLLWQKKRNT